MFVCSFVCLIVCVCLFVCLFVSVCVCVCLCLCLFCFKLFICLFVCLFRCLYVCNHCVFVRVFLCLVYLFACLSVCLFVCVSIFSVASTCNGQLHESARQISANATEQKGRAYYVCEWRAHTCTHTHTPAIVRLPRNCVKNERAHTHTHTHTHVHRSPDGMCIHMVSLFNVSVVFVVLFCSKPLVTRILGLWVLVCAIRTALHSKFKHVHTCAPMCIVLSPMQCEHMVTAHIRCNKRYIANCTQHFTFFTSYCGVAFASVCTLTRVATKRARTCVLQLLCRLSFVSRACKFCVHSLCAISGIVFHSCLEHGNASSSPSKGKGRRQGTGKGRRQGNGKWCRQRKDTCRARVARQLGRHPRMAASTRMANEICKATWAISTILATSTRMPKERSVQIQWDWWARYNNYRRGGFLLHCGCGGRRCGETPFQICFWILRPGRGGGLRLVRRVVYFSGCGAGVS
jgi:hypothetical protein